MYLLNSQSFPQTRCGQLHAPHKPFSDAGERRVLSETDLGCFGFLVQCAGRKRVRKELAETSEVLLCAFDGPELLHLRHRGGTRREEAERDRRAVGVDLGEGDRPLEVQLVGVGVVLRKNQLP